MRTDLELLSAAVSAERHADSMKMSECDAPLGIKPCVCSSSLLLYMAKAERGEYLLPNTEGAKATVMR